jgi:serine/threonine protein kinase
MQVDPKAAKRYRIGDQIGDGGFSTVCLARDRRSGRRVAAKMVSLSAAPASVKPLLQREVDCMECLASAGGEGVVGLFEAMDCCGGVRYLFLELMEGGDLAGRLEYYHIRTYNPRFYSLGSSMMGHCRSRRRHQPLNPTISNITIYGHATLDSTPWRHQPLNPRAKRDPCL